MSNNYTNKSNTILTFDYYTEETAKKLVEIGFCNDIQYLNVNGKQYPKLPDINKFVNWLRENINVYIVVEPVYIVVEPYRSENLRNFSIDFRYRVYNVNFNYRDPILLVNDICLGDDYLSATYYAVMQYLDFYFNSKENNKEKLKKIYNNE